uniref:Uncharacterized protein n=1 Tax=Anguilla anguilla TaxID=7936 RepID=A0A0E9Q1D5_ANGAN
MASFYYYLFLIYLDCCLFRKIGGL